MSKVLPSESSKFSLFGKYSVVVITTIIFLVLVLSVLGLNFYSSFQVEANAEAVNVAGRQRMLSQRTAKSLLNTQEQYLNGEDYRVSLDELKKASELFNSTLNAFKNGGEITGTNGSQIFLPAVTTSLGRNIVNQAETIWAPFYGDIQTIIESMGKTEGMRKDQASAIGVTSPTSARIRALLSKDIEYARSNVNSVLKLMNDLTNEQERIANQAATQSRIIQVVGIIASLLCFFVIMQRIFGQLRRADSKAAAAQQETQQIFDTVDQGLFLINKDFNIGEQHSRELERIFAEDKISGLKFTRFISQAVSSSDLDKVKRYLKLLFDPHKKQKLIGDLNPLNQVAIQVSNGDVIDHKYLRFNFARVMSGEDIGSVLTSVSDITKEVELAKDLERESKRGEQQLEMISQLINADRSLMPVYINSSSMAFAKLNRLLKETSNDSQEYRNKAKSMMTTIHGVKGESAALSLTMISELCHEFEEQLKQILDKGSIQGNDFLPLTVLLDRLMSNNSMISQINSNVFSIEGHHSEGKTNPSADWSHLRKMCNEIATRQGKQASLALSGLDTTVLGEQVLAGISSITSQLIRNAVTHGIESPDVRLAAGKKAVGSVSIALFQTDDAYRLTVHDDGQGIDFKHLADSAVAKGVIQASQASKLSRADLAKLIFIEDLSTNPNPDQDSGRGVGMAVVKATVSELGGKILIQTSAARGTTFTIELPTESAQKTKAA